MNAAATTPSLDWLPDFCRPPILFSTLVAAQVAVLVIGLAPGGSAQWRLNQWIAASALALWLALTCAVALCKLRPGLLRLPRTLGASLAWLLPVAVAFFGSLLLHELNSTLQLGFSAHSDNRLHFAGAIAAIAGLLSAVLLRYFHFQQQLHQQVAANARAEVEALQARIKPHFLFNSMNTIASLVRRDPDTAERAIEDLSDLFRAALGAGGQAASLAEELHLCERYLAIEALRLGERLRVDWKVDDDTPRNLPLPRLLLQPLVENAVIHGIARLAEGGTIAIAIGREADMLRIAIGNPYPPVSGSELAGNQHAQSSVAQRLAYAFGPRARMTVAAREGYYSCELRLPLPSPEL